MRKVLLLLCMMALIGVSTASATIKWDMATAYPEYSFHTQNINQFVADVKKGTNGEFEIKVHSGQSLIKHPEIKSAIRNRQIPIGEFLLARLANENPVYKLDAIPFLASSFDEAKKLWQAQKPYVEMLLEKQGLKVLFSVPWPPQGLYTKKSIESVDNLKTLRFRTYNKVTERMAKLLGMVPTQTEATEMATAFITGRVNSMMTSPAGGANRKAWDFCTHFYHVQAWLPKNIIVVSNRSFQKLEKSYQESILKAAKVAEVRGWEMSKKDTDDGVQSLVKGGMQGIEPSNELMKGLKEIGQKMTEEWLDEAGKDGLQVIEAYRSLLKK